MCKNLAIDLNDLKPGSLLKDKDRLKSLDEQLSAPKKDVKQPEELLPSIPSANEYAIRTAGKLWASVEKQESDAVFTGKLGVQGFSDPVCVQHLNSQCELPQVNCFPSATVTVPPPSTTCAATVPPQPQYSYHDIHVYSLAGIAPHITLNPTVSDQSLALYD